MKSKTVSKQGFTLIEIMIVVAIIALLASIAIPNYIDARNRSNMVTCVQNLHAINNSVQQWAFEARKQAGQTVSAEDIRVYLQKLPFCPSGGSSFGDSYEISTVDAAPACLRVTSGRYAHQL
jgi:prepilin-type N-terminal cleavage/methylation domain-containing protein